MSSLEETMKELSAKGELMLIGYGKSKDLPVRKIEVKVILGSGDDIVSLDLSSVDNSIVKKRKRVKKKD